MSRGARETPGTRPAHDQRACVGRCEKNCASGGRVGGSGVPRAESGKYGVLIGRERVKTLRVQEKLRSAESAARQKLIMRYSKSDKAKICISARGVSASVKKIVSDPFAKELENRSCLSQSMRVRASR